MKTLKNGFTLVATAGAAMICGAQIASAQGAKELRYASSAPPKTVWAMQVERFATIVTRQLEGHAQGQCLPRRPARQRAGHHPADRPRPHRHGRLLAHCRLLARARAVASLDPVPVQDRRLSWTACSIRPSPSSTTRTRLSPPKACNSWRGRRSAPHALLRQEADPDAGRHSRHEGALATEQDRRLHLDHLRRQSEPAADVGVEFGPCRPGSQKSPTAGRYLLSLRGPRQDLTGDDAFCTSGSRPGVVLVANNTSLRQAHRRARRTPSTPAARPRPINYCAQRCVASRRRSKRCSRLGAARRRARRRAARGLAQGHGGELAEAVEASGGGSGACREAMRTGIPGLRGLTCASIAATAGAELAAAPERCPALPRSLAPRRVLVAVVCFTFIAASCCWMSSGASSSARCWLAGIESGRPEYLRRRSCRCLRW